MWTSEVAKVDWEAARVIACAIHTTFTAGKVRKLDLGRLADFEALLELLTHTWATRAGYDGGNAGRLCPIDGSGNT